jgi:DNA-binding response OmpR family regulator
MASQTGDQIEVLRLGAKLEVRPGDGLAIAGDRVLALSVREFHLLTALMRRPGTVISREELFATVWRRELRAGDRSIDVYIHKLRVKLEDAVPDRRFIHTHIGFGYRLAEELFTRFSHPVNGAVTG